MFCNKCGSQVNPGDNICSNCGNPIGNSYTAQNYQAQNNYQQPYYAPQPNRPDFSSIISNKVNIGWFFIIVSLLCSLGNLFMSIVTYSIPTGRDSIKFGLSFLQLSSIYSYISSGFAEELGGDGSDGGFIVASIFIWIFTVLSIILVLVSIYMLIKDKTNKSFLLSAISLVSAGIAKLIEIIFILSTISKIKKSLDYDDFDLSTLTNLIKVPVFCWIMLAVIVLAIVLIFVYAYKTNMNILPKRTNTYNPYQYQNTYPYPNQYQNTNQNPYQNQNYNNYQNNDQNNNQY